MNYTIVTLPFFCKILSPHQVYTVSVARDTQYEKCEDYTKEFGYSCVPYYQCSNGSIITDGAGIIDIR